MLDSVKERISQYGIVADALRFIRRTDRGKPNGVASLDNDGKVLVEQLPDAALVETDPTISAWAKELEKPTYTAFEVGADAEGTAESVMAAHNVNIDAHNDIRFIINNLTTRINTVANSDDVNLDQLSELVAYIKSNKSLIDGITTNKINYTDVIDNLTTNVSDKPLSAAQGIILKQLIDGIASDYVKSEMISSLETRVKALEDALGGLIFRPATSAPIEATNNTITFVDLTGG